MRKSRTVAYELDAEIIEWLMGDPHHVFKAIAKLDIAVPSWAQMFFIFTRYDSDKLDVSFFEDAKEFFLWYSKILIRFGDDIHSVSFSSKDGIWQIFLPPTLIGVSLRTRLRD